jgi:hypothetical protein
MSSGLQVDFAQAKVEGNQETRVETSQSFDLSTLEPGVDVERRQGGPFIRGRDQDLVSCFQGHPLKIAQLISGKLVGENSELISGKAKRDWDPSGSEEEKGKEGDQISQKTEKLAKDSALEASRPPTLILPEGDHGYRGGMPPYVAEPREEKSQEESGSLLRSHEDFIMEVGRTARRYSAAASPQSPRAYSIPEKKINETQNIQETPATDSEKSEPRLDEGILIKSIQGLQHVLQNLSQGIMELNRNKKWAQKAYARRERRRAAKQKEVVDQPSQFPADSPRGLQQDASTADIGKKPAEEGTQSPKDWEPLGEEKVQSTRVEFREDQQLSGCGLADTQTLTPQEGLNR